jgi:type II secretion system protein H
MIKTNQHIFRFQRVRARRYRCGFTLLEIMVVVVILAIIVGVAMPSMSKFNESNRLKTAARELASLMRYARTEAIFNERVTEVFLDIENREYWVDLRSETAEDDSDDSDRGRKRRKAKPKKTSMEDKRPLEKKIIFGDILAYDENIIKDSLIAIDFFPDGHASPTFFTLKSESTGREMCIEVLKATGFTEVTAGSIEDKQEKAKAAQAVVPPPRAGSGGSY